MHLSGFADKARGSKPGGRGEAGTRYPPGSSRGSGRVPALVAR
jgi:hypothetical protein